MDIRCNRISAFKRLTVTLGLSVLAGFGCAPLPSQMGGAAWDTSQWGSTFQPGGSTGGSNSGQLQVGNISSSNAGTRLDGVGVTTVGLTARVNQRLRVRLIPGINDRRIGNTGYTYSYSKLSLVVGLRLPSGEVRNIGRTQLLSNGLSYWTAPTRAQGELLDLSNHLSGSASCTRQAGATCRYEVQVVLSEPRYDFCVNRAQFGCETSFARDGLPGNPVHYTHPWNVLVQVETDDTGSI